MLQVIFKWNEESMCINLNLVHDDSLLWIMYRKQKTNIVECDESHVFTAIEYVNSQSNTPIFDEELIKILDYWGVYRSYNDIYRDEKFIRDNLYNPDFNNHAMCTDSYYKLFNMKDFHRDYNEFILSYKKPEGLLFPCEQNELKFEVTIGRKHLNDRCTHELKMIIESSDNYMWMIPCFYDERIKFLFDMAEIWGVNIFIAGGYVFNNLMRIKQNDSKKSDVLSPA